MSDYIERKYVLYSIEEHKKIADECSEETKSISNAIHDYLVEIVKLIPVADVAPIKLGVWESWEDPYGITVYACSACGNDIYTVDGTPEDNDMNYCPNCGAKMVMEA